MPSVPNANNPALREPRAGAPVQRRRDQRMVVPVIRLEVDRNLYQSIDWSLGGIRFEPYYGGLQTGNMFTVTGLGPGDGEPVPVTVRAQAIRVHAGRVAARFMELDERAYNVLEALIMRRRREMAAAQGRRVA